MTPEDRVKAKREIVRVLRNLSTYHTDEDAADLILYALDCLAALSPEPAYPPLTAEEVKSEELRVRAEAEARTEGGESQ